MIYICNALYDYFSVSFKCLKKNSQPLAHTNTQLFLNMKSISKEAMHYLPFT